MEANQILQSSMLDIIFAGRNKAYGAYHLRKTYGRRMFLAISGTATLILLFFMIRILAGNTVTKLSPEIIVVDSTILRKLVEERPVPPPPELPAKKLPPTASVKLSKIEIVNDKTVIKPPPDIVQLEKARIDIKTTTGSGDPTIIAPPSKEKGTGIIYKPTNNKRAEDTIATIVEIPASFPGGEQAWIKYVRKAIESQLDEFNEHDFGTCIVKFVVDKQGNVSNVVAISMKGSKLAEVAVNAIRKGPKWIPAQQNGHYLDAYRLQPVTLQNPNQ